MVDNPNTAQLMTLGPAADLSASRIYGCSLFSDDNSRVYLIRALSEAIYTFVSLYVDIIGMAHQDKQKVFQSVLKIVKIAFI